MQDRINVSAEATRVLAAGPDRWAQLGVPRGAPFADIKAQYKRLCALHPDKNPDNQLAAEAFAVVASAYAELRSQATAGQPGSSQPDAPLQATRWQAFTGHQQAHRPAAQHQQPFPGGGGGSQENRTPDSCGNQAAGRDGGAWQASSKWGRPTVGSSLLRAQPVAGAAPVAGTAAGGAPAAERSTHKRQAVERRDARDANGGGGGSSGSSSSESDADSEDATFNISRHPPAVDIKPSAFYGSKRDSPLEAAAAPPAASLYGLLGGRRSSGGAGSGWLGGAAAQRDRGGQPPPGNPVQQVLTVQQAAAPTGASKWGGRNRLAELLHQAPVPVAATPAAGVSAIPGSSSQQAPAEQQAHQRGSGARQAKRQQQAVEFSIDSDSSRSGDCDGECSDALSEGEAGGGPQDAAAAAKQQLTAALLRQEAAARLAAQASGSGAIVRGRDKALRRYRKKRQKQQGGSSGKAAAGAGSGRAARGSGKQQPHLKLTVVRAALSSAAV